MQSLMYVFPVILGSIIILGVTTTVIRRIKKSNGHRGWIGLTVVVAVLCLYGLVRTVYQPYGLYERHIKTASGYDLGPSTDFVFADTWIGSDETGKFSSVAVIKMATEDQKDLIASLVAQHYIKNDAQVKTHEYLQSKLQPLLMMEKTKQVKEDYVQWEDNPAGLQQLTVKYYFAFLDDDETVIAYVWNK